MTHYIGAVNGRAQFWDGSNLSSIGAVQEFTMGFTVKRTTNDGTGTRNRYAARLTEAIPTCNLKYAMQDFNLLNNYLIPTAQGNLSAFSIRADGGQEKFETLNILPDTVEVATGHGKEILVTMGGIAENWSSGITATWEARSAEPVMTWKQTTTLSVFGVNMLTDFREWSFKAANNVYPDITGNVITPAGVYGGKADYSGRIDVAKSMTALGTNILNASTGVVVYAFKDRAGSPTTKTYTFNNCDITQAEVQLPMGLVVHRVDWASQQVVIT